MEGKYTKLLTLPRSWRGQTTPPSTPSSLTLATRPLDEPLTTGVSSLVGETGDLAPASGQPDRPLDGLGNRLYGGHADRHEVRFRRPRRQRKNRISIEHRVHGRNNSRQTVMTYLREFVGLLFCERRVRRDYSHRRVRRKSRCTCSPEQRLRRVEEVTCARIACAREHLPGPVVDDVPKGVHDDQSPHNHAPGQA